MSTDPRDQQPVTSPVNIGEETPGITKLGANPSITDAYADVLKVLSPRQRRGLIAQLAMGFYDGWRPGRAEVTDLVAVKKGILTADECEQRRLLRNNGHPVPDIDVFSTHGQPTVSDPSDIKCHAVCAITADNGPSTTRPVPCHTPTHYTKGKA